MCLQKADILTCYEQRGFLLVVGRFAVAALGACPEREGRKFLKFWFGAPLQDSAEAFVQVPPSFLFSATYVIIPPPAPASPGSINLCGLI
jgi:hypothetical protein